MDEGKLKRFIETVGSLGEQFVKLEKQVAELRSSVRVLQLFEAKRLCPDSPLEGLKQLQDLEQAILSTDPNEKQRQRVSEVSEFLKLQKKSGGGQT
jgi:hypothetical protein